MGMRGPILGWVGAVAKRVAWAPSLVFGLHMFLSRVAGGYTAYPDLDLAVHLLGGAAFSLFALGAAEEATRRGLLGSPAPRVPFLLAFFATASAALFWEFAEFLSDRWFGTHAQGGLHDTLLDMALGVAGSCLHLGAAAWRRLGSRPAGRGAA
ncbi:MAG: hypothetical protein ACT4PV_07580 [Planctomycetaceae bacterium]